MITSGYSTVSVPTCVHSESGPGTSGWVLDHSERLKMEICCSVALKAPSLSPEIPGWAVVASLARK